MKEHEGGTISVLSTVWISVSVIHTLNNGTSEDMHTYGAFLAFPAHGVKPVPSDWQVATWSGQPGGVWWCMVKVGPSGFTLPLGRYDVWAKVVTNDEVPVDKVYQLVIA